MVMPLRGVANAFAPPHDNIAQAHRLRCDHVGCVYPSRSGAVRAFDDVSFTAQPNELASIVGTSGCAKSTLLWIVAGLLQPTEGDVRFEGRRAPE